jgi:hypothetical protein
MITLLIALLLQPIIHQAISLLEMLSPLMLAPVRVIGRVRVAEVEPSAGIAAAALAETLAAGESNHAWLL